MAPILKPNEPMPSCPSCQILITLLQEGLPRVRSLKMTIALVPTLRLLAVRLFLLMFTLGFLRLAYLCRVALRSRFLHRILMPSSSWPPLIWYGFFAKGEGTMACLIPANHCKLLWVGSRLLRPGGRSSLLDPGLPTPASSD